MWFYSAKAIIKYIMNILTNKFQFIINMRRNSIIYSIIYFWSKSRLFVLIELYLKLGSIEGGIWCDLPWRSMEKCEMYCFMASFFSFRISFSFSSLIFFWMSSRAFWCSVESCWTVGLLMLAASTSLGLGILLAKAADWFFPQWSRQKVLGTQPASWPRGPI